MATGSQIESYRVSYLDHDLLDKASRDTIRQVANSLCKKLGLIGMLERLVGFNTFSGF